MEFSHVGIVVQDLAKAVEFYTQVLGCTLYKEEWKQEPQYALLKSGEQFIELLHFANDQKKREEGVISHLAFKVRDINKEIQRLKELGCNLDNQQPREIMDGIKIYFFQGPNGESIEFLQFS